MEGDWGHNAIMLTGNSNAILCSFMYHVSLLHAMSLYSMTIRLSSIRNLIDYVPHLDWRIHLMYNRRCFYRHLLYFASMQS